MTGKENIFLNGAILGTTQKELKDKHPQIPWKEIAGLRDVLTHEYFGVSIPRVWKVIIDDLPRLKEQIEKIMKDNP